MTEPAAEDDSTLGEDILDSLSILNVSVCRLYDVGMALLEIKDPKTAELMDATHREGRFLGSLPVIADQPFEQPPN